MAMIDKSIKTSFEILKNNMFVLGVVWHISKLRFMIKTIVTILSAVLPTLNILIVRHIISLLESDIERSKDTLWQLFWVLIGLSLMQLLPKLFAAFNSALIEPILASKVDNYMNNMFFEKAREFDYKNFENPVFYDKYTRALGQSENITHTVFNGFFQLLGSIISLLALSALIASMDWIVILFALFAVIVNFIRSLISGKLNFTVSQALTPMSRRQNYIKKLLYDSSYAKDIKCNDAIDTGKRYYYESYLSILDILKSHGMKIAIINVIVISIVTISSTSMTLYLFAMVWTGAYSIAYYSALMSSAGQFENTLNTLFNTVASFHKNSLEIDNLKFIYFYKKDEKDGSHSLDCTRPFKIEIKNLYFKYPNASGYALKDISLTIMPEEKISFVGLNGSGKTTLIKLILGLYKPESGEILINDKKIEEYKKEDVQKNIGVIFQDHKIFAYTVKENVVFESEFKNESVEVLKKLGIYSNISSLPKGTDTPLSKEFDNEGIILSGGEAQKICIARALNKISGLYIFDEPSSALDPKSEYNMNALLYEITDKTTIFISHRLTTAIMADKIFLLNNGELVEHGNHKELIALNGMYYELFKMQSEGYLQKD